MRGGRPLEEAFWYGPDGVTAPVREPYRSERWAGRPHALLAPKRSPGYSLAPEPGPTGGSASAAAAIAAAIGAFAVVALAPLRAHAEPLPDNHYSIDLFQGPLLAPIHVTGIAGSYAAYAESIEGMVSNAAAPVVREPYSVHWLEVEADASVSFPLSLFQTNNDFDNSGNRDYDYSSFFYLTAGALVQVGDFGVGASAEVFRYTLTGTTGSTHVTVGKYHLLGAYAVLAHQLMFGGGARIVTLGLDAPGATLTMGGAAPELGFLVRPDWRSYRLGVTFRFPVNAGTLLGQHQTDASGVERAGGLVLPEHVVLPWELEAGISIQVGPRPLNPAWIDPHDEERTLEEDLAEKRAAREHARRQELLLVDPKDRPARERELDAREKQLRHEEDERTDHTLDTLRNELRARYWNWPRERMLVTAELLITGAVERGVSIATFLGQDDAAEVKQPSQVGTSGADVNFSPRFGIETEPIVNHLVTRFGSYYEPNRYGAPVGRQHFTFGADLRLFPTTWFGLLPKTYYKVLGSFDAAPRYQSASFGLGIWR